MRTIILASTFLFLVLGEVAGANEIYMNCKFFKGMYKGKGQLTEYVDKDIDLSLVLNKRKKTIRSFYSTKDEKYSEYDKDEISWHEDKLLYQLNLINGNLLAQGEIFGGGVKYYNYQCEKTQKKFYGLENNQFFFYKWVS